MENALYVVGTPIGNIEDMSPRAINVLRTVDFIAAEDMEVSKKLLDVFNIDRPMVSYFQNNIEEVGHDITKRISAGESCAIITDAGMPCISDPGQNLIELCADENIHTVTVPGPSALIAALAVSGMETNRFSFEGFLSTNRTKRHEHLIEIQKYPNTIIFYEANKKMNDTIADLLKYLGNRKISIVKDLTKTSENVNRTCLEEACKIYRNRRFKGEYVLVVEGYNSYNCNSITDEK